MEKKPFVRAKNSFSRDKRYGSSGTSRGATSKYPARPFVKKVGASAPYKGGTTSAVTARPSQGASLAFSRAPFQARKKPASAPYRGTSTPNSRPTYAGAKTSSYPRKSVSAPYRGKDRASTTTPFKKIGASAPYKGKAPVPMHKIKKFEKPKKPRTASASWGVVAEWYDKHLETADTYHEKVLLPNVLRLVAPEKGDIILDLACGQGYFTKAIAEGGATVTGIDLSRELIELAEKRTPQVTYHTGNAGDLSRFPDASFDKVLIVLAIQNIEDTRAVCTEASRVLKTGGTFHIVMNHPAFRIPKASSWGYDEKRGIQYRRVDQYLSESREEIEMHPGMEGSPKTLSFHRPLQYYFKAFIKAGLAVDRFEEWISHKESDSGPRARAENNTRKEIPLFLYLRARK